MKCELNQRELNEAIKLWEANKPIAPVKEELGGDYYFRCGWAKCDQVIKRDYNFCPHCGSMVLWED